MRDEGTLRPLTNDEIAVAHGYGNFSLEQAAIRPNAFYARLSRLINPRALPPAEELRALHESLHAQLKSRVRDVLVAEELVTERPGKVIAMPAGRAIFRTTGAWEALSTPCRDMRLLVGIDVLLAFVDQHGGSADLARLHREWSRELSITYERSDGSKKRLTLENLIERRTDLEMGYNPNDCAEVRWGAPEGSEERSTCTRRAPKDQLRKMRKYRHWFVKRYSCG